MTANEPAKSILVTGGNRGIGIANALVLVRRSHRIHLTAKAETFWQLAWTCSWVSAEMRCEFLRWRTKFAEPE